MSLEGLSENGGLDGRNRIPVALSWKPPTPEVLMLNFPFRGLASVNLLLKRSFPTS